MNWNETKAQLIELTGREFGDSPAGANLRGANLRGADLRGANLRGANLYRSDLYGADLYGADLCRSDLYGADLYGADLYGANLRGANLRGADLEFTGLFSFAAGKHFSHYVPWQRYLKIGCIGKPLEWWLENYEAVGRENYYTETEIARYGAIIRLIAELYPVEAGEQQQATPPDANGR